MKIAINGFGRIGRLALRIILEKDNLEVVAINDLCDAKTLAYLLKYDTAHRRFKEDEISNDETHIIIGDKRIKVYNELDPEKLPWKENDIDVVLECSGHFTDYNGAYKHIKAGAKKVLISAPAKGNVKTVVYNVNDDIINQDDVIISGASCTTNALAPILKVINDKYQIKHGYMVTVHAVTNDQATLDIPHKKGIMSRRGRAAFANIVPTSTGAAKAIGKVIPEIDGKLDGIAYRVPVIDGSLLDITLTLEKHVTKEEINKTLKENANETLYYTEDPIVSSDILGLSCGTLVDGLLTNVLFEDEEFVKIVAWYDNEFSYTNQLIRTLQKL